MSDRNNTPSGENGGRQSQTRLYRKQSSAGDNSSSALSDTNNNQHQNDAAEENNNSHPHQNENNNIINTSSVHTAASTAVAGAHGGIATAYTGSQKNKVPKNENNKNAGAGGASHNQLPEPVHYYRRAIRSVPAGPRTRFFHYNNQQSHRTRSYNIGLSSRMHHNSYNNNNNRRQQHSSHNNQSSNKNNNATGSSTNSVPHHHHHQHYVNNIPVYRYPEEVTTVRNAIESSTTLENTIRFHNESLVDHMHRTVIKLENAGIPEPTGTHHNLLHRNAANGNFVIVQPWNNLQQYAPHPMHLLVHPNIDNRNTLKHIRQILKRDVNHHHNGNNSNTNNNNTNTQNSNNPNNHHQVTSSTTAFVKNAPDNNNNENHTNNNRSRSTSLKKRGNNGRTTNGEGSINVGRENSDDGLLDKGPVKLSKESLTQLEHRQRQQKDEKKNNTKKSSAPKPEDFLLSAGGDSKQEIHDDAQDDEDKKIIDNEQQSSKNKETKFHHEMIGDDEDNSGQPNNDNVTSQQNLEDDPRARAEVDFDFVYPPRPLLAHTFGTLPDAVASQLRQCPALRLVPTQTYKPVLRLGRGAYGETWLVEARPHLRDQQKLQSQHNDELKRFKVARDRVIKHRLRLLKEIEAGSSGVSNNNDNAAAKNSNKPGSSNTTLLQQKMAASSPRQHQPQHQTSSSSSSPSTVNAQLGTFSKRMFQLETSASIQSKNQQLQNTHFQNNTNNSGTNQHTDPNCSLAQISNLASTGPIRLKNGYEIPAQNAFVCKVINRESSTFSQVANEVNILANVAHPNITAFIEGYVETGRMNLVMEYVDGGDLRKEVDDRRTVAPGQTAKRYTPEGYIMTLFSQLCLGVEYLHRHNILHRDLKPENMIVSKKWLVKIADFGLAKRYETDISLPVGTSFVGTPGYVASEIWQKKGFSEKADVFSLGCILYELITLDRAFPSHGLAKRDEIPENLDTLDRRPITRLEISRDVRELCDWLLEPDPADRPSMLELLRVPVVFRAAQDFVTNFNRSAGHDPVDRRWGEILEEQLNEIKLSNCSTTKEMRIEKRSTAVNKTTAARTSYMTTRSQQLSKMMMSRGGGRTGTGANGRSRNVETQGENNSEFNTSKIGGGHQQHRRNTASPSSAPNTADPPTRNEEVSE